MYQSKSRAAHWDGRNEIGEPVASDVYFYTLTAGEFTATREDVDKEVIYDFSATKKMLFTKNHNDETTAEIIKPGDAV